MDSKVRIKNFIRQIIKEEIATLHQSGSSSSLRITVRAEGWDKGIVRRFFILFFNNVKREFPNAEVVENSNVIKTLDDGHTFSNPKFIIPNVNNLGESKEKVKNIFEKWEKVFGTDIDVDIDFTRFAV
jgi:hypothetical protein